jgi:hypothetical protein
MKPGSLVQYKGAPKYRAPYINYPDPSTIYTVRHIKICEDGSASLFVEELVMGYCQCGCNQELGSDIRNWQEVQPAEEGADILCQTIRGY